MRLVTIFNGLKRIISASGELVTNKIFHKI